MRYVVYKLYFSFTDIGDLMSLHVTVNGAKSNCDHC